MSKFCPHCGVEDSHGDNAMFCPNTGLLLTGTGNVVTLLKSDFSPNPQQDLKKITFRFWSYFIATLIVLAMLWLGLFLAVPGYKWNADTETIPQPVYVGFVGGVILIGVTALIISNIFYLMFLYAVWRQIPPKIAQTTPNKAVGFMFIPLFNLYWQFIALYGLGKKLNQTLQIIGLKPSVNANVGLWICILSIAAHAPLGNLAGIVIGLIAIILALIFMFSLKNAAHKLLQYSLQNNY
ncbi:MAG: zinc ribbon domain-containing protein [Planctomycetaceae bacterium]|jgi:hypothetical protein|nr:zinc ribbon domain-containing protein [Planctomycetaceae bacterium]